MFLLRQNSIQRESKGTIAANVQSFAAGAFQEGFQSFTPEALAQVLRRQLDGLERDIGRGIEIEDHPVREIAIIKRNVQHSMKIRGFFYTLHLKSADFVAAQFADEIPKLQNRPDLRREVQTCLI